MTSEKPTMTSEKTIMTPETDYDNRRNFERWVDDWKSTQTSTQIMIPEKCTLVLMMENQH